MTRREVVGVVAVMLAATGACARGPVARPPAPAAPQSTSTGAPDVLALAASAPVLSAGVSEIDDTMRYTITGNTSVAIRAQLHPDGALRAASDSEFVGYTATHIDWRFQPQHDSARQGCTLRHVHVTLSITTTLPVWRPASAPPNRALVERWRTFLDAVGRHEQGHANIARHTAADLYAYLDGAARPQCDSLAVAAANGARAVWAAGHLHQLTYDVVTQHGIAQGTIWPP